MGDVDVSIFSISGAKRGMRSGRNHQPCPPAVVITHDSDNFSPSAINPSSGEGLLSYKNAGLGSSTLSLATEGRNGGFTGGPPSRTGSPRHSRIHPSEGSSLPKSGSSMAVFSTEGQMLGIVPHSSNSRIKIGAKEGPNIQRTREMSGINQNMVDLVRSRVISRLEEISPIPYCSDFEIGKVLNGEIVNTTPNLDISPRYWAAQTRRGRPLCTHS
ncbi:uncharacterized protein CDAR_165781 [Caerostris darwini]|uniref:Uncharacterized protein n=1 Tax=Caerostris darwini TaxID=1538125 RepID=A0AAV4RVR9_9ARAC|nr:uncharacterized protein CDAR_165781 [Caerostris darwini]